MSEQIGDYIIHDNRFQSLILGPHVLVEHIWDGGRWCEGPVWFGDSSHLIWSDIPNNRMMSWSETTGVSVFRQPSNYANGNTRDLQGRLVTCEHGGRRVTRTEFDGQITILADQYSGKSLNSPNDVVVAPDGAIWFTDPDYGIMSDYEGHAATSEQSGCFLFRLDGATGELTVAANDFAKPNGLAFSPDGTRLYVADTGRSHDPNGPAHIRVFDVDGGRLRDGGVFAAPDTGMADGFRVDVQGNLWTSAGDGVQCFSSDGDLLGRILIPEIVANCTFGGPKRNRLFVTATSGLYAVFLGTKGAGPH